MQANTNQKIQDIFDKVIRIVRLSVDRLYRLPIDVLRDEPPSMEDVANACKMCIKLLEGHGPSTELSEAVRVINEAAEAVLEGDEGRLTDCAYHLEDFLDRISP